MRRGAHHGAILVPLLVSGGAAAMVGTLAALPGLPELVRWLLADFAFPVFVTVWILVRTEGKLDRVAEGLNGLRCAIEARWPVPCAKPSASPPLELPQ